MNSFMMMKNIEVCKGFSILNVFMWFLSYTYSVKKIKTIEDYCAVLTTLNDLTVFLSFSLL